MIEISAQAWLADGVHMAWRGRDIVVLDVRADRYSCLIGGADLVRRTDSPDAVLVEHTVMDDLCEIGLLDRNRTTASRYTCKPAGRALEPKRFAPLKAVVQAGLFAVLAGRRFRNLSLTEMIAPARSRTRTLCGNHAHRLAQAELTAFITALPWVPDQGQCLQRAYVLRRFLQRRGVQTHWVFGVRTWPFHAHCWLQIEDFVLADDVDRVRGFTPIMVV